MPPTPKKRGRRRLTALEVLQAKSAFCRSQRIFLRLACSWERFEGSAEATKGAPVPPIGGLTVLRIPSRKGRQGCFWIWALGWAGGRAGGIDGWVAWEQQPPTALPFLPWQVWGVGQGGGRGGGGWGGPD